MQSQGGTYADDELDEGTSNSISRTAASAVTAVGESVGLTNEEDVTSGRGHPDENCRTGGASAADELDEATEPNAAGATKRPKLTPHAPHT